eukprot:TRINITY_DN28767_c0_g1_i1.p2 TRINITY_DN28767_c0_g1~~TRINITY_DN28767_c0_g1_i1.p2  ORF type:complete len:186 (+),score=39.23 TRINITY_DN28767_c0_g1_i1:69-626(+)
MSVWSMFFTEKPELKLAVLDEIMTKQKRFQTKADWEIEVAAQNSRTNTYMAAVAAYTFGFVFSAPEGQVRRMFGPPDSLVIPPWRMAKDACQNTLLGMNGFRPQATGIYRQFWCMGPAFLTLSMMTHYSECTRWAGYLSLKDKSTFGEIASKIEDGTLNESPVFAPLDSNTANVAHGTTIELTMA